MKFIKRFLIFSVFFASFIFSISNEISHLRKIRRGVTNLSKYVSAPFPNEHIATIVNVHNKLRSTVANGKGVGQNGNLPTAGDMLQIYWDEGIANKAQTWANNCKFQHSSKDFRKLNGMKLGENLYISMTTDLSEDPNKMDWEKAVQEWYNEIKDYNKDLVPSIRFGGPMIGHFSQVIWSQTYLIGCGYCSYKEESQLNKLYVCEYGKAGNMISSPNYKIGAPGSSCPKGFQTSSIFQGLCCKVGACGKDNVNLKGDIKGSSNDGSSSPSSSSSPTSSSSPSSSSNTAGNAPSAPASSSGNNSSSQPSTTASPSSSSSSSNSQQSSNSPSNSSSSSTTSTAPASSGNSQTSSSNPASSSGTSGSSNNTSSSGSSNSSSGSSNSSQPSDTDSDSKPSNGKVDPKAIASSINVTPLKLKKQPIYTK